MLLIDDIDPHKMHQNRHDTHIPPFNCYLQTIFDKWEDDLPIPFLVQLVLLLFDLLDILYF